MKVGANATLVDEGGDATRVYTVVRGMLRLVRYLPDGRRHVMAFLVPGDFTGLPCGAKHENSLEAVTESELCSVDRTRLQELGRLLPQLQERLLALTCADLRRDREVQLSLGRRTPIEAIATFLLDLSRRAERFGESASMLSLPMTRGDIADHLGLTIETVSRTFTKLRQDGLIRLPANHLVELRDREALEKHAGHSDE